MGLWLALEVVGNAQEPPPLSPDDALCPKPEPGRAAKLALDDDSVMIAIVEATAPRNLEDGTPVRVIRIVEGALNAPVTVADRQPTLECLSRGIWIEGRPVIGVFLVAEGEFITLVAWPFVDERAVVNGERLTVEELLELGRTFVEPTPTPLPPGVPPPPTLVPPDSGRPQQLPSTGGGSGADGSAVLPIGLAVGALASLGAAWFLLPRRRA